MTRRRFARPCSFSRRKTARRYGFQGLLNLHSLPLRFQGFAAKVCNPKAFAPIVAIEAFDDFKQAGA
jgi:hypothetical protein